MEYKIIKKKNSMKTIYSSTYPLLGTRELLVGLGKNINLSVLGLTTILLFQGQYAM